MSSNSELSDVPFDDTIEETLREIIRKSKVDPITINTVRTAAEEQLGLAPGFFKNHDEWKARSKTVINDAFNEPSSQRPPSPTPNPPPKQVTKRTTNASTKRSSTDNAGKSRKRQKRATADPDESPEEPPQDEDGAEPETAKNPAAKPKQRSKKSSAPAEDSEADDSDEKVIAKSDREESEPEKPEGGNKAEDGSDSEMSIVLDEAPPKKRRQKSAGAGADSKPKAKAKVTKGSKGTKASASASKDVSPDEAEIKRLQGWLLKCGIRKLWHRELAPYDTPKAKIKHLKEMLKDAGMDGRYSVEKARAIKEQRELAADLEAVKEGAKKWGNEQGEEESSEEDTTSKPRRRAAASRFVDFGDDDDEDE